MPLGRDTRKVPSNILLDRGPGLPMEREIWGSEPQFAVMLPVAKYTLVHVVVVITVMTLCFCMMLG